MKALADEGRFKRARDEIVLDIESCKAMKDEGADVSRLNQSKSCSWNESRTGQNALDSCKEIVDVKRWHGGGVVNQYGGSVWTNCPVVHVDEGVKEL